MLTAAVHKGWIIHQQTKHGLHYFRGVSAIRRQGGHELLITDTSVHHGLNRMRESINLEIQEEMLELDYEWAEQDA